MQKTNILEKERMGGLESVENTPTKEQHTDKSSF